MIKNIGEIADLKKTIDTTNKTTNNQNGDN